VKFVRYRSLVVVYLTEHDPIPISSSQCLDYRSKSLASISRHLRKQYILLPVNCRKLVNLGGDIPGRYPHTESCPTNSYNYKYVYIYRSKVLRSQQSSLQKVMVTCMVEPDGSESTALGISLFKPISNPNTLLFIAV